MQSWGVLGVASAQLTSKTGLQLGGDFRKFKPQGLFIMVDEKTTKPVVLRMLGPDLSDVAAFAKTLSKNLRRSFLDQPPRCTSSVHDPSRCKL